MPGWNARCSKVNKETVVVVVVAAHPARPRWFNEPGGGDDNDIARSSIKLPTKLLPRENGCHMYL